MTTRLYREPKWLHDGDPNDDWFSRHRGRACINHTTLYFSSDLFDLLEAKRLCASCPVFESCARWGLAHYDLVPNGMFFGLTEHERKRIHQGKVKFQDWRRFWSRTKYTRLKWNATNKQNQRNGIIKRERDPKPACPSCGEKSSMRCGWDRESDTQRYRCLDCGYRFTDQEAA
jgi:predicted RNA-binding Zn-ribbon protein involved in translation (DUF1610 family)